MSEIKVERGIPIPPINRGRTEYPFLLLKIGDSFLFPPNSNRSKANGAIFHFRKKHPEMKFSLRTTKDGFRVWRVG